MIVTTLAFVLLTAIAVGIFVRREHRGGGGSASARPSVPCPRCGAPVPAGARACSRCGVPMQIFELVSSSPAGPRSPDAPAVATHAVVRADMCVGCGSCVAACPEPGAISLEGKLAVVHREHCRGHGECVAACPVGGIFLSGGDAVHHVRVPDLTPVFESRVPGLYVVGELGGRGLIKNAVNEGKIAVEHAARSLAAAGRPPSGEDSVFDVAVVGSGPAGLSAGLEALRRGLRYVILEQGTLADSIRKYPRHKILLAEPVRIPLYGDLWVADASKEELLRVWETVLATTGLEVRTGHRVETVERGNGRFRLGTPEGVFEARRVILAMGRRGTPRRLDVPGEDLDKVFYDIVEMEAFQGRKVLVVGGGDSAAESALGLANQPGTQVHLSYRGASFDRLKERNRVKLHEAVNRGKVGLLLGSRVREIQREAVVLEIGGETKSLPNDFVIVRIGGEAPFAFLERIGVDLIEKDLVPAEEPTAHAG